LLLTNANDDMTRQISRSLAGSESIYTKCPGTGISFSLRERWR
jgi:hypothetical protein